MTRRRSQALLFWTGACDDAPAQLRTSSAASTSRQRTAAVWVSVGQALSLTARFEQRVSSDILEGAVLDDEVMGR